MKKKDEEKKEIRIYAAKTHLRANKSNSSNTI